MWPFKKKPASVVSFNRQKLNEDSYNISNKLHVFKHDDGVKLIMELIKIGKNISLLDCASSKNEEERIQDQGKLAAYEELQVFLETSLNRMVYENSEGKKPVTGTINAYRRVSNQAGSSL